MKNQMVKRILALILALATLVSFVSCSTPLNLDEMFGYGEKTDENNGGEKPGQDEKPGDTACEHEWSEDFVITMQESAYCYEYACGKCEEKKYVEMEIISVSEKWLYDDARKIGDYSETALPNAASKPSEYAVFFYFGDGDEAWFIDVQNSIYAEDYEAVYKDLEKAFPVTVKADVVSKVDA